MDVGATVTAWDRMRPIMELIRRKGLKARVTQEEAQAVYDEAMRLLRADPHSPDYQLLLLYAALICDKVYASGKTPAWLGIAHMGTDPAGNVWFQPMRSDVKYAYALLLTNNAIARCMCDDNEMAQSAVKVAETARDYFDQLVLEFASRTDDASDPTLVNPWMARLYVIFGRFAVDHDTAKGWGQYALSLLRGSTTIPVGLNLQARVLADAPVPSFLGEVKRRTSELPAFDPSDIYLFN